MEKKEIDECVTTARAINKETNSPLHNRLKMLGKKEEGQDLASLSQGTFIKYMLELISKKPDEDTIKLKRGEELEPDDKLVLRNYFIEEKDSVILKILVNLFKGVENAFKVEWNSPDRFILSKSIGFGSIIKAFLELYKNGIGENDLSEEFFSNQFEQVKAYLDSKKTSNEQH